ncbi:hypothetical protein E8E12_008863 [Didymella heteroderae]|uniref:DUF7580 domain-containing protein n=1 Tax=Didymella heteroderae TaxID=1769908 RepID=A0A9P4WUC8_9PLEO|nr:hypothetical protein E8E12_008863 [Didymella heteroderae]
MSGVEIAGLVLGVLPLLIQGIESYNEGLDPIKSFMRWDKELPQCIRKLRNQHVHYAQTMRILLEPITAEVELAEMMTDPGSSRLWRDKQMAAKLQDRLQESYHAYQGTIADIERIAKQIASKLDLDRASEQLRRNDLEALLVANPKKSNDKFEIRKRIRFGMSKKTVKALLEELNDCNRELERFTEKSEKIETYRKAAKPSWQAAEINIEDEEAGGLTSPLSSPKPRMSKSVSFSSPPPYSVSDPVFNSSQSLQEVTDICASIRQVQSTASRIGLSLDAKKKLRGVYTIDTTEKVTPNSEVVTLEDLLDRRPTVNGRRVKLSKKERYSLALTLASSVLYLNSTPWLTNQWAARDIQFHQTVAATTCIDIEHPYLAPASADAIGDLAVKTKALSFQNKNTVLLALAVALLELYFGTTAEKYQENEHGACNPALHQNSWMLCAMAHQWAEESQDELSAAFLSAVRHCLRCFSDPGVSLQDSDFLQAAAEGIVLPLQEELYQFLGKTAT